jgi:hypothetical protein
MLGGVVVRRLVCERTWGLEADVLAGVSVAASVAGVVLMSYLAYVSWYGRWGLPRLKRVRC